MPVSLLDTPKSFALSPILFSVLNVQGGGHYGGVAQLVRAAES